jgi:hypothetical protein
MNILGQITPQGLIENKISTKKYLEKLLLNLRYDLIP